MLAVCLLNLSAAFDTVDHELLLARRERTFCVRDRVLIWFKSYSTGRKYCVIYARASSSIKQMTCSVSQGSVLGPLFFLLYTADLSDGCQAWRDVYTFANDTHLYIHCEFHHMAISRDVLERCIQDIGNWMSANCLQLNLAKTQISFKTYSPIFSQFD